MKKILKNIRRIREEKKITQSEIALELGIATSNYSRIESGQQEVTLSKFLRIAEILQVNPCLFFAKNANDDDFPFENEIKATLTVELKKEKKEQVLKLIFGESNLEILNK